MRISKLSSKRKRKEKKKSDIVSKRDERGTVRVMRVIVIVIPDGSRVVTVEPARSR